MEKYKVVFITAFTYGVEAESKDDAVDAARKEYTEELQNPDSTVALYDAVANVAKATLSDGWLFD